MSKSSRSNRKKRKREKKRLLKLQQQRQGLVAAVSTSHQTSAAPPPATKPTTSATTQCVGSSSQKHFNRIRKLPDGPDVRLETQDEKNVFGSSSSRRRALPTISFVFPRKETSSQQEPPERYQFGCSLGKLFNGIKVAPDSHIKRDDRAPSRSSDTTRPKETASIDEILSSRRKADATEKTVEEGEDDLSSKNKEKERKSTDDSMKESPAKEDRHSSTIVEGSQHASASLPQSHDSPSECVTVRSPYLSGVSVEEAVRDKNGLRPRSNSTDGELNLPQRGLCDERKVLQNYLWRHNIAKAPPRGLNNLGNTCFLNSILQCLAYCPPFCQSIMAMQHHSSSQPKGKNQGKRISLMVGTLFRQVHGAINNQNLFHYSSGPISPRSLVSVVPLLGNFGNRSSVKFLPGRQEDAHEFLVHLLDAMNDGELREAGINAQKSGWRDRLPVPRLDETTFIHRIFGGYMRSQVRCTTCGYKSNTYDPFLDLSLEISRKSCTSLATAFKLFTRKETLDSENRWKCSGCEKRVCATKHLTIFRPPLSLCIQLKRFSFGGSISGFGGFGGPLGGKKISKPIEFPAHMKLPLSDGRTCAYSLSGIVVHVGGSASSGHYTAYVKKPGINGGDKWFYMDDSSVHDVTEREVLRQRDVYILLYCREEVKLEFPTPPLRGSMSAEEAIDANRARVRGRSDNVTNPLRNGCVATSADAQLETVAEAEKAPRVPVQATSAAKPSTPSGEPTVQTKPAFIGPQPMKTAATMRPFIGPLPLTIEQNGLKTPQTNSSGLPTPADSHSLQSASSGMPTPANSKDESSSSSSDGSSSSSFSTSSSSSSSSPSSLPKEEPTSALEERKPTAKHTVNKKPESSVDRITLDRGENGKLEVMMGPRFKTKKTWKPVESTSSKDEDFQLLGNAPVGRWDADERTEDQKAALQNRATMLADALRAETKRKRKMHLDRHDALLDQGKTKKVKQKNDTRLLTQTPQNAQFQRIQKDMQRMNRGRAKGHVFRSNNSSSKAKKKSPYRKYSRF